MTKPSRECVITTCQSSAQPAKIHNGTGMPSHSPLPIARTTGGNPDRSPPRVRNSPSPRRKIIADSDTRIGLAPVCAMIAPISQPAAAPVASAAATPASTTPAPASAPPCDWITQAIASPAMFAVKVTARLKPPEISGISIASVKRPSSGNWNAIDTKVLPDRNRSDAALIATTTTARKPSRPATSAWTSGARTRGGVTLFMRTPRCVTMRSARRRAARPRRSTA